MKKAISLGVAAAMAATLLAGCGTAASSVPAASSEAASTADSTAASSEVTASETHEINTTDPIELTISWWGGDSRHEAYQKALEAFHEKYPNITVSPTYGAWSGWEEKQSTALAADQALMSCRSTGTGCTSTAPRARSSSTCASTATSST